ncbi:MAG: enoyl-CoA hydratase/isomerase family protein [Candidatus Lokiarchaeota archaeon]|nr:enoyl-CoA hydratase/isomerase family protein [Candidatus Lokiarchaeota archaeon]
MSLDFDTIQFRNQKNGIGILTLNRPQQLNAMSFQMFEDLHEMLDQLTIDLKCRVVILKGNGRAFCAGLDLKEMAVLNTKKKPKEYKKFYYLDIPEVLKNKIYFQWRLSDIIIKMRRIPQPIISLIDGPATGGGFALALASDVRVAGEDAKFNNAFIKLGLSGSDVGTSYFLPRLIGMSRATEILYTGRFIEAEEANIIGLVSKIVRGDEFDLFNAGIALAKEFLAISPFGLKMTKQAINLSMDAPSLDTLMQLENRAQILCTSSKDIIEGMSSFFEKRKPKYPLK